MKSCSTTTSRYWEVWRKSVLSSSAKTSERICKYSAQVREQGFGVQNAGKQKGEEMKQYHVRCKTLEIPAGGHRIHGEFLTPEGVPGPLPTVIVSHGLNSTGAWTKCSEGIPLAEAGFAVYCFDFWGGSMKSASGGDMKDMTVFTEKDDLNAVIDHMKALDTVDSTRLFLLGESQGGFVSAVTAAGRPQDIRAMVLYYPAFCIPHDARARHSSIENVPETERFGPCVLGRAYNTSVWDYDVYSVIPGYRGPVLILHGDADKLVDISYGKCAAEVYENAEFVVMHREPHGFSLLGRKRAAKFSAEFLKMVMAGA